MTAYTADPDALHALASALLTRAEAIGGLQAAVTVAADFGFPAPAAAAGLLDAETWSRQWATGLADRAAVLERHDVGGQGTTFTTWESVMGASADRTAALTAPSPLVAGAQRSVAGSPHQVAGFLAERTSAEQQRLAAAAPELVATAPGVPLGLRFAANRRLLEMVRDDLARRLAGHPAVPAGSAASGAVADRGDRIEEELAALDRLLAPGRRFLLVDWAGDGRLAEWIGPTDARHVALFVPGMGAEKLRMDGLATIARRMVRHDPTGGGLAVVTALVYDAPDWLGSAALGSAAEDGAFALSELIGGLPEDRHLTVIGHSYGSLVVARSLFRRCGERIGDVVVLGSPGLGVDHVSELPVPPDRLWVGRTAGDEVGAALHPRALVEATRCLSPVAGAPFQMAPCPPSTSLIHGRDPASTAFGAQIFDTSVPAGSGQPAHNRYWAVTGDGDEQPTAALRNLLLIATGRHGAVDRRRDPNSTDR